MITRRTLVAAAKAGRVPAEVLHPGERAALMAELVGDGLSDREIAERTRWSTYTVARIRAGLGLAPNREAVA